MFKTALTDLTLITDMAGSSEVLFSSATTILNVIITEMPVSEKSGQILGRTLGRTADFSAGQNVESRTLDRTFHFSNF